MRCISGYTIYWLRDWVFGHFLFVINVCCKTIQHQSFLKSGHCLYKECCIATLLGCPGDTLCFCLQKTFASLATKVHDGIQLCRGLSNPTLCVDFRESRINGCITSVYQLLVIFNNKAIPSLYVFITLL